MKELLQLITCSFVVVLLSTLGVQILWMVCVFLLKLLIATILPIFVMGLFLNLKDRL